MDNPKTPEQIEQEEDAARVEEERRAREIAAAIEVGQLRDER